MRHCGERSRKSFGRANVLIEEFPCFRLARLWQSVATGGTAAAREGGVMEVLLGVALVAVIVDELRILWRGPVARR